MTSAEDPDEKRIFNVSAYMYWLILHGCSVIDDAPSVYFILRDKREPPKFLLVVRGGWFMGKDPNDPLDVLNEKWVEGTNIIY